MAQQKQSSFGSHSSSTANGTLMSVMYSVEKTPDPLPKTSEIQPGQLALSSSSQSPKAQKVWNYVRTPAPIARSEASLTETTTVTYRQTSLPVHCLFYYEHGNKLKRKLITAELRCDTTVKETIRQLATNCGSLRRLNKTSGRVYRAPTRSYREFVEIHADRDAARQLTDFENHFYVFDTSGYVSRKVPVAFEVFPFWHI